MMENACQPNEFYREDLDICVNGSTSFDTDPADACIACAAGRYAEVEGIAEDGCVGCPVGKYVAVTGSDALDDCGDCSPGSQTENATAVGAFMEVGASGCVPCTAGQYSAHATGGADCVECPVGRYAAATGSTSVDDCTASDCVGMVPSGPGYSTSCDGLATDGPACTQTCEDGYVDNNGGSGQTYSCPGGTFTGTLLTCTSDGLVWAACAMCQPGHEPNANQTACAGCIAASFSPAGVRCLSCTPGRKR
jgi:hypothetical protein